MNKTRLLPSHYAKLQQLTPTENCTVSYHLSKEFDTGHFLAFNLWQLPSYIHLTRVSSHIIIYVRIKFAGDKSVIKYHARPQTVATLPMLLYSDIGVNWFRHHHRRLHDIVSGPIITIAI